MLYFSSLTCQNVHPLHFVLSLNISLFSVWLFSCCIFLILATRYSVPSLIIRLHHLPLWHWRQFLLTVLICALWLHPVGFLFFIYWNGTDGQFLNMPNHLGSSKQSPSFRPRVQKTVCSLGMHRTFFFSIFSFDVYNFKDHSLPFALDVRFWKEWYFQSKLESLQRIFAASGLDICTI